MEDGTGAVISYRYDVQGKPVNENRLISENKEEMSIHFTEFSEAFL